MVKMKTPISINGKKYWSVADVAKKLKTSKPNVIVKIQNNNLGVKLGTMILLSQADVSIINKGLRKPVSDVDLKKLLLK
jgi:hypothetical protein